MAHSGGRCRGRGCWRSSTATRSACALAKSLSWCATSGSTLPRRAGATALTSGWGQRPPRPTPRSWRAGASGSSATCQQRRLRAFAALRVGRRPPGERRDGAPGGTPRPRPTRPTRRTAPSWRTPSRRPREPSAGCGARARRAPRRPAMPSNLPVRQHRRSMRFHRPTAPPWRRSHPPTGSAWRREGALAAGYTPCRSCRP